MIRVIGDLMLDRWIHGSATRLSPEAPVPVLKESHQTVSAGGAANLATNLVSLGESVELCGAVGEDADGYELLRLLGELDKLCLTSAHDLNVTTVKTRLVSQSGQHIMRWDRETLYKGTSLLHRVQTSHLRPRVTLISDYNKGACTQELLQWATAQNSCVFVDPKQAPEVYQGAWLVKPNQQEYESWAGEFSVSGATQLIRKHGWRWMVITQGAGGVHVVNHKGDHWHYQEPVREVADVTGAGDCVLAVLAHAYNQNMSIPKAAELACYAAARNVEQRGVVPVKLEDLNRGIVFTNGCFDILHAGHIHLLKQAREMGKKLIVGINSDESVRRLKGPTRPVNDQNKRLNQISLLPWVDEVHVFDEDTPLELLQRIQPDIIVKGGDYRPSDVVGNHMAEVRIVPLVPDCSTSAILDQLQK